MKVSDVQNNANYKQTHSLNFNGKTHKSLKKYVNLVAQKESKKLVADANNSGSIAENDALQKIYKQGKRVIEKFDSFMKPQHKRSSIVLEDTGYLKITNPVTKSEIPIYSFGKNKNWLEADNNSIGVNAQTGFAMDLPRLAHLNYLEETADELLTSVKPETIDAKFLSIAETELKNNTENINRTGIIGKIKTIRQVNKVVGFACDILSKMSGKEEPAFIEYINNVKNMKKNC